jgi:hypothetical protein
MLRITFLLMFTLGLNGCASLSKEQCLAGNWRDIGHRDGRQGYKPESLDAHNKACAEYGVTVNRDEYQQGYNEGIQTYCSPVNGRYLGERGSSYNYVCPADKEAAFLHQYRYGRELYEAQHKIKTARDDLATKEEQLRVEKNASVRTSLRSEISALDDLIRTLQRSYDSLRDNPPRPLAH